MTVINTAPPAKPIEIQALESLSDRVELLSKRLDVQSARIDNLFSAFQRIDPPSKESPDSSEGVVEASKTHRIIILAIIITTFLITSCSIIYVITENAPTPIINSIDPANPFD